ncbi:hypothetical protein VDGL01_07309 [Verticillium dahliae]
MQGRCGGVHWLTSNGDVPLVRNVNNWARRRVSAARHRPTSRPRGGLEAAFGALECISTPRRIWPPTGRPLAPTTTANHARNPCTTCNMVFCRRLLIWSGLVSRPSRSSLITTKLETRRPTHAACPSPSLPSLSIPALAAADETCAGQSHSHCVH